MAAGSAHYERSASYQLNKLARADARILWPAHALHIMLCFITLGMNLRESITITNIDRNVYNQDNDT